MYHKVGDPDHIPVVKTWEEINADQLRIIKNCDETIESLKITKREALRSMHIPCIECSGTSSTQVRDAVLGTAHGQTMVRLACGHFTLTFNCLDPDLYKKEDEGHVESAT
jgi:hypothetical protein